MLAFYTESLGGTSGDLYENPATGLRSYFVSFGGGARLELMSRPGLGAAGGRSVPWLRASGLPAGQPRSGGRGGEGSAP